MKEEKCFYCNKNAEFFQPEDKTGEVISVCKKHFTYMFSG